MSCCEGNCGCGATCGCKMYPDLSYSEAAATTTETLVLGVAPQKTFSEGAEATEGAENGCKCNPCTCNPCTCK